MAGDQAPQEPAHQGSQVPRRTVHRRKDGRELKRISAYVEASLAIEVAVFCARTQRDISAVIADAVSGYIREQTLSTWAPRHQGA